MISRLTAAGAVLIGKANVHEFATGHGEISYYGPTRNPWNLARNSGGSSSGCAAAVATLLCLGAIGTDTGGSIRIPASYCGIVGFKPTYGLVPIRGIVPVAPTYDHCGPLTRTVEDAAILLDQIAGYDRLDITSVDRPREGYHRALPQPVAGFRLGRPMSFFDRLEPDVAAVVREAIAVLGKLTAGVRDVTLPATEFDRRCHRRSRSVGLSRAASSPVRQPVHAPQSAEPGCEQEF